MNNYDPYMSVKLVKIVKSIKFKPKCKLKII